VKRLENARCHSWNASLEGNGRVHGTHLKGVLELGKVQRGELKSVIQLT